MSRRARKERPQYSKERQKTRNNDAIVHQDKKSWSPHDMISVKPLTSNQAISIENYFQGDHIALLGSAGTGKTFLALYLASRTLVNKEVSKIAIFRSTVQSRDMGFLPGDPDEKCTLFETPYNDGFAQIFNRASTYTEMKARGLVEFHPTAFLRGTTFDDTIMIIDEAQNMTFQEIDTVLTRVGENSTVIIIGDIKQDDLKNKREVSGLSKFISIVEGSGLFSPTYFTAEDCVRSGFVKDWLLLKEDKE